MDEILIKSKNMKLFLNSYFYDQCTISNLLDFIRISFNISNIEYNATDNRISIKFRKSEFRKNRNFYHESQYYTKLFNQIFAGFFHDNQDNLRRLIEVYKPDLTIDDFFNFQLIPLIYNLLTTHDSSIIICL